MHLDGACPKEGDDDRHAVDGQLKLEELGDAVVDVATPHDSLDDARKVVIGQYNIGSLFGDVSASDTLGVAELTKYLIYHQTLVSSYQSV